MKKIIFLIISVLTFSSCKNENVKTTNITLDATYKNEKNYIAVDSFSVKNYNTDYGKFINGYTIEIDDYQIWNLFTDKGYKIEIFYRYNTYNIYFIKDYKLSEIKNEAERNKIIKNILSKI